MRSLLVSMHGVGTRYLSNEQDKRGYLGTEFIFEL